MVLGISQQSLAMPDGKQSLATRAANIGDYGIHILEDRNSNSLKVVDIVAIHGLNGHFEDTWTVKRRDGTSVNWLKDLLPEKIPNARIMAFSYNSRIQFSKSTSDVYTFAEQLLEQLLAVRQDESESGRSIICICHSLGGIDFKQASLHISIIPRSLHVIGTKLSVSGRESSLRRRTIRFTL